MTAKQVGNGTKLGPRLPEKPNPICLEFQNEVSVCVELAFLLLQLFNKKSETLWSSSVKWSMKACVGRHPIYTSIRLRGDFSEVSQRKITGHPPDGQIHSLWDAGKEGECSGGGTQPMPQSKSQYKQTHTKTIRTWTAMPRQACASTRAISTSECNPSCTAIGPWNPQAPGRCP